MSLNRAFSIPTVIADPYLNVFENSFPTLFKYSLFAQILPKKKRYQEEEKYTILALHRIMKGLTGLDFCVSNFHH